MMTASQTAIHNPIESIPSPRIRFFIGLSLPGLVAFAALSTSVTAGEELDLAGSASQSTAWFHVAANENRSEALLTGGTEVHLIPKELSFIPSVKECSVRG
jgi:hypothetical protein